MTFPVPPALDRAELMVLTALVQTYGVGVFRDDSVVQFLPFICASQMSFERLVCPKISADAPLAHVRNADVSRSWCHRNNEGQMRRSWQRRNDRPAVSLDALAEALRICSRLIRQV